MRFALEIVTLPSSRGCRNVSRVLVPNSPSSSIKNTPFNANVISPALIAPPTSAVWVAE